MLTIRYLTVSGKGGYDAPGLVLKGASSTSAQTFDQMRVSAKVRPSDIVRAPPHTWDCSALHLGGLQRYSQQDRAWQAESSRLHARPFRVCCSWVGTTPTSGRLMHAIAPRSLIHSLTATLTAAWGAGDRPQHVHAHALSHQPTASCCQVGCSTPSTLKPFAPGRAAACTRSMPFPVAWRPAGPRAWQMMHWRSALAAACAALLAAWHHAQER